MVCGKCGNQLQEGSSFCTACGNKVGQDTKQSKLSEMIQVNNVVDKVNSIIERFGDRKINKYLSIASIISMIFIKLFGFIVTTVLVTILNSVLVIYNYKQNEKLDIKMLVMSLAVFFVGLLIVI